MLKIKRYVTYFGINQFELRQWTFLTESQAPFGIICSTIAEHIFPRKLLRCFECTSLLIFEKVLKQKLYKKLRIIEYLN